MNPQPWSQPYPDRSAVAAGASDDARVLRRMASRDEAALGEFFDRWNSLVHAVVLRIVRQREDVEDVVEEVFWQAWRQAERFDTARGSVQTWLLTIARSRALDRVRSLNRLRESSIEGESSEYVSHLTSTADPAMDAESRERRAIVMTALETLPAEQRQALELGYFGGYSQSEIAERTGLPLGTIKTRMRLAMQKLRERLQVLREDAP